MKVYFSYNKQFQNIFPICTLYNSSNTFDEDFVCIYITGLKCCWARKVLNILKDTSTTEGVIGVESIDAVISYNDVKIGYELDEPNNDDFCQFLIDRNELIYLIERWIDFIGKPIKDANVQEIIDSKDAYK